MDFLNVFTEMLGTIAFAISGAMIAMRKKMDIFGVCMLGLVTATGGGMVRDITLGRTPPSIFSSPIYIAAAILASIVVFLPPLRAWLGRDHRLFDSVLLLADSLGLGTFTVHGLKVALDAGFSGNIPLPIFSAAITGVGGGVFRDLFAGERPYIFIKHIYACASIAGAALCLMLRGLIGDRAAMLVSGLAIVGVRLFAAKLHLNLPKA